MTWTIDRAQRQLDARLAAVAASLGARRVVLVFGDVDDKGVALWRAWATFTHNDGPPTVSDVMTLLAEGQWLSDVVDAAEVFARNLLARARHAT